MSKKEKPVLNVHESRVREDVSGSLSSGARLCATVIATTAEGTTSALNEARRLSRDLDAHITLLDQPPVSLDFTIKQQCSLVLRSNAMEADVTIRACFCHDQEACLRNALRRRALVVIGGRRHWWISREERLEKALHRLGHHVIFVDVCHKSNKNPQSNSPVSVGSDTCQFRTRIAAAEVFLWSEALR